MKSDVYVILTKYACARGILYAYICVQFNLLITGDMTKCIEFLASLDVQQNGRGKGLGVGKGK